MYLYVGAKHILPSSHPSKICPAFCSFFNYKTYFVLVYIVFSLFEESFKVVIIIKYSPDLSLEALANRFFAEIHKHHRRLMTTDNLNPQAKLFFYILNQK